MSARDDKDSGRREPLRWFTSSYSNGAGGECVEVAVVTGLIHVRDSVRPAGAWLTFRGRAWVGFLRELHGADSGLRPA